MAEYQRKLGKYVLPGTVYMKTLYQIRDYFRLKEKIQDAIDESPDPRAPKSTGGKKVSPTERKALKVSDDSNIVRAIDKALNDIPEEYRKGVWRSVMYNEPYPLDASRSTYGLHKSRFVYKVAENLNWI